MRPIEEEDIRLDLNEKGVVSGNSITEQNMVSVVSATILEQENNLQKKTLEGNEVDEAELRRRRLE